MVAGMNKLRARCFGILLPCLMANGALAQTAGAPAAALAAPSPPAQGLLAGAPRAAALSQANAALNAMQRVEGRFLQIAPDGNVSQGSFYLSRPGKVRFAYDAPSPLVIVSDGVTVAIEDRGLKSVDRTPLRATPLYFVLKQNINLEADARVTKVERDGEQLLITVKDRKGQADGAITLGFVGLREPELREWRVSDGTGQTTLLSLRGVRPSTGLDPRLFILENKRDSTARSQAQ